MRLQKSDVSNNRCSYLFNLQNICGTPRLCPFTCVYFGCSNSYAHNTLRLNTVVQALVFKIINISLSIYVFKSANVPHLFKWINNRNFIKWNNLMYNGIETRQILLNKFSGSVDVFTIGKKISMADFVS